MHPCTFGRIKNTKKSYFSVRLGYGSDQVSTLIPKFGKIAETLSGKNKKIFYFFSKFFSCFDKQNHTYVKVI